MQPFYQPLHLAHLLCHLQKVNIWFLPVPFFLLRSASSPDDIEIMQKEKLTPFPVRDYFLKPLNEEAMFYSNL